MKTSASRTLRARLAAGFTLREVLIASALLLLLTGGFMAIFTFGIRKHRTAETKPGANDAVRKTALTIADEIRGAMRVQVGTGGATDFTEATTTNRQVGSALQIIPANDPNTWIRYYCETDPSSTNYSRLCRTTSDMGGKFSIVVARSITNANALFSSEDSFWNGINSNQNSRVVGVYLQVSQVPLSFSLPGNTKLNDLYEMRTGITRH